MARDWPKILRDSAQPHCDEPVRAAALVSPRGTMGSFGLGQVSGLASMMRAKKANQDAGGLGKAGPFRFKHGLMALTEHTVYVFEAAPKGFGVKVKQKIAEWPRSDVEFAHEQKTITKAIVFDVQSTGDHYELEMSSMMDQGIGEAFVAELSQPT